MKPFCQKQKSHLAARNGSQRARDSRRHCRGASCEPGPCARREQGPGERAETEDVRGAGVPGGRGFRLGPWGCGCPGASEGLCAQSDSTGQAGSGQGVGCHAARRGGGRRAGPGAGGCRARSSSPTPLRQEPMAKTIYLKTAQRFGN